MAKTSSRSRRAAPKTGEVATEDATQPEEVFPTEETPRAAAPQQPPPGKRPPGRPIGSTTGTGSGKRGLFQKMEGITADDWGTRASVHLYRMEPYTDRLRSGTVVYIMKYHEPIDEDRVLKDHGSGKYRALLNFRKVASNQQDEIDRVEFELLNMNYPPRIPKGEWVDDPRNKKWEWARAAATGEPAAGAAAAPNPQQNVVDTLRVFNEIQDAADDRAASKAAPGPGLLDTIRALKELSPSPAPQTDNTMLNTIASLMMGQVTASQEEARELRKEIREMRQQPAAAASTGIDTLTGIVSGIEKLLPTVQKMFPNLGENVAGAVTGRSRMSGWQEFFQPILPEITRAIAPVLPMVAGSFFNRNNPAAAAPQQGIQRNPGAALPAAAPAQQQQNPLIEFLNGITQPLLNYLRKYAGGSKDHEGEDFAQYLFDGYGPTWKGKNWHEEAKAAGLVQIVALYQNSPYWGDIAPMEKEFGEFVQQFLSATPGSEEDPEETEGVVVDLTQEEESGAYV